MPGSLVGEFPTAEVALNPRRPKDRPPLRRLLRFARDPRSTGLFLTVASVAALGWANASPSGYARAWSSQPGALLGLHLSAQGWINEGLMTFFFLLVGLEIRREIGAGELGNWRRAAVPVTAAVAGMILPAAIYAACVRGQGRRGWGIPMATDVAFSLGALALVGRRSPFRLRILLLTLAVVDDIISVLVLVVFYSRGVDMTFLLPALACLAAMAVAQWDRMPLRQAVLPLGIAGWYLLTRSGVEGAVVGVALGLCLCRGDGDDAAPAAARSGPGLLEHRLQPAVNMLVLPAFALANAGISFSGSGLGQRRSLIVFGAVVAARLLGKPAGIAAGAWFTGREFHQAALRSGGPPPSGGASGRDDRAAGRRRSAPPPEPPQRAGRDFLGIGSVAAVGFTVPLLIVRAALPDPALAAAAIAGLLASSVVATGLGAVLLHRRAPATLGAPLPQAREAVPSHRPPGPPRGATTARRPAARPSRRR